MRLIDADALTRRVFWELPIINPRKDIIGLIDNAPTINGVLSIVRCKDCKYYTVKSTEEKYGWCNEKELLVDETEFCSWGVCDVASKDDVIDRLNELHREVEEVCSDDFDRGTMHGLAWAIDILKGLPSADKSADQNVADVPSEKTIVNDCDLISREDAIETVQSYLNILIDSRRHGDDVTLINVLTDIRNKLSALPSAEPNKISVNVEYDVEYLPDKDGIHQAKATITKAEPVCETCRHNDKEWYSAECDSCCGNNSHYEPSDLISREDAIEVVGNLMADDEIEMYAYYIVEKALKTLPSVDRPITRDTQCQEKNDHSGEVTEMVDLISRAEAIEAVCNECEGEHYPKCTQQKYCREVNEILELPSADRPTDESCQDCPIYSADRPTVIKSKTLMPTKDFKEWAKRIREVNPNAVVIPCDAEVMSADRPKGEWKWTHDGQCSECGFHNTNFDFNFCPNCGADMRKDADR